MMPMMNNRRIGLWSWALSGEEIAADIAIGRARDAGLPVAADVAARYSAMLAKQQKIAARAPRRPLGRP